MTRQTQQFRVRYVAWSGAVHEVETAARDTAEAIRTAREAKWPPTAVAFRLIDTEGREVLEQLSPTFGTGELLGSKPNRSV
jgi:hypothetical protein